MATMTEQNALVTTVKSWPERIKSFYNDVRTEMRKVTAPSWQEVQATTTVVVPRTSFHEGAVTLRISVRTSL